MTRYAFPFRFDGRGRTAPASQQQYLRSLIELVLFTRPGERVNRPDFGSGLMQLVFAPANPALATAVEMSVQGALQSWLADLISVESVNVSNEDATLRVEVVFQTADGNRSREVFERSVP